MCPLVEKNCQDKAVIYECKVTTQKQPEKTYIGSTGNDFKTRYYSHSQSFRHKKHNESTELLKYVWKCKEDNDPPTLKWKIVKQLHPYRAGSRNCALCNQEKLEILRHWGPRLLNTRNEIASKCPHNRTAKLRAVKANTHVS